MPQPSAPPKPAESAPEEAPLSSAERQILRAKELAFEAHSLGEDISANRDYLRLMEKNKELSEDQVKWLRTFYPNKGKNTSRSPEEIEATRKLRQEAVKEIAKKEAAATPAA